MLWDHSLPNFFRLFIQDFAKQVGPGARKLQKIEKTEEYQHLPGESGFGRLGILAHLDCR